MTDQTPSFIKNIPDSNFGGEAATPAPGFEQGSDGVGFEMTADPNRYTEIPRVVSMAEWPGGFRGDVAPPVQGDFYDDFLTDEPAPIATPRDAEPGPGQWNVTDTGNYISIENGKLIMADGANSYTSAVLITTESFADRGDVVGIQYVTKWLTTSAVGTAYPIIWNISATPQSAPAYRGLMISGSDINYRHAGTSITVGTVAADQEYESNIICREGLAGFALLDGKLLYLTGYFAQDTLGSYPALYNRSRSQLHIDSALVPTARQIPNVLASDSFNRADSATLGTTDGMGHPERHGGEGLAWTDLTEASTNGQMEIDNGRMRGVGDLSGAYRWLAKAPCGSADVVIEATLNTGPSSGQPSIAARIGGADTVSHLKAKIHNSFKELRLQEYTVAGGVNQIAATGFDSSNDTEYRVVFILDGDALTMVVDDSITLPGVSSLNQTVTDHGINLTRSDAGTPAYADDFVVWPRTPTLQNYTPPQYQFIDKFTTDEANPLATPRYAEPGPGDWAVIDTGNWISISGGAVQFTGTPNNWTDQLLIGNTFTYDSGDDIAGIVFEVDFTTTVPTGTSYFALTARAAPTGSSSMINHYSMYQSGGEFALRLKSSTVSLGDTQPAATAVKRAMVHRNFTGDFFSLFNTGSGWVLQYPMLGQGASLTQLRPCLASRSETDISVSEAIIYTERWFPTPLASDSFDRADSSDLGSTDGAGHPEQNGGSGLAWTEANGGFGIISNKVRPEGGQPPLPRWHAVVPVSSADMVAECLITVPNLSPNAGMALRYDNPGYSGGIFVCIQQSSGTVRIFEYDGAANNEIGNASAGTIVAGDEKRLVAILDGDNITAVWDDSTVATAVNSRNQTVATAGLMLTSAGNDTRWDNFVVWPRRPTDTGPLS